MAGAGLKLRRNGRFFGLFSPAGRASRNSGTHPAGKIKATTTLKKYSNIRDAMKATSILVLVVGATLRTAAADCLYDGDMMLMPGQSTGAHVPIECVDATNYAALDLVCGPDGEMIEVDAVHACPTNQIALYDTPHCVQCGPRGERGSARCLASPDGPCPEVVVASPLVEENDA